MAYHKPLSWKEDAEAAMKRRKEKNTSWGNTELPQKNIITCKGCGAKGTSQYNPFFCDSCIRNAFDVIGGLE